MEINHEKDWLCGFIALVFASCGQKERAFEQSTPEEKWEIIQEYCMAPDASASAERPLANILSEQEVLLKAADFAIEEGVLDPSYYAYQTNPALMDAKIETPVLVTDASSGVPDMYILNAVDQDGIYLARISVSSNPSDTSEASFIFSRFITEPTSAHNHLMTKREATALIQSQFPNGMTDGTVSEPMMIGNLRLGDDPHSHRGLFWYFTVGENVRSTVGTGGEYVIDAIIGGYRSIPGGVTNRAAINMGHTSHHLDEYRMVKLDRPLHLFDKLNTARSVGGVSFTPSAYPIETVGFTPAPLK
ncbi:MAG: hypothetical protein LBG24_00675 [Treponema sp.]|jgi:hypothetical protein|nr:hypothetical protein [Treponema sp.]